VHAIEAAGGVSLTVYASVVEALPPVGKAIGGTAVAAIGAAGAVKKWRNAKRERNEQAGEGKDD
jgi:hypothetical protein